MDRAFEQFLDLVEGHSQVFFGKREDCAHAHADQNIIPVRREMADGICHPC